MWWIDVLYVLLGLVIGLVIGFFVTKKIFTKQNLKPAKLD